MKACIQGTVPVCNKNVSPRFKDKLVVVGPTSSYGQSVGQSKTLHLENECPYLEDDCSKDEDVQMNVWTHY